MGIEIVTPVVLVLLACLYVAKQRLGTTVVAWGLSGLLHPALTTPGPLEERTAVSPVPATVARRAGGTGTGRKRPRSKPSRTPKQDPNFLQEFWEKDTEVRGTSVPDPTELLSNGGAVVNSGETKVVGSNPQNVDGMGMPLPQQEIPLSVADLPVMPRNVVVDGVEFEAVQNGLLNLVTDLLSPMNNRGQNSVNLGEAHHRYQTATQLLGHLTTLTGGVIEKMPNNNTGQNPRIG